MKKISALVLAAIMVLSLAACGKTATPNQSNHTAGEDTTKSPELQSSVVEGGEEAEAYREHVNIALASQITTLDPGQISNV